MVNTVTIDDQQIQIWTTDVCEPSCVAVNMTQAIILLEGSDLTEEEKTDVTELMSSYCRIVDEHRLTGYGDTEFEAIADLFSKARKVNQQPTGMTEVNMSEPYREGKEAFYSGYDISQNPYSQSDAQSDEWAHGWMDAYADSK